MTQPKDAGISKPSPSERHDQTNRVARDIIETDAEARRKKTAKLRSLRLEQDSPAKKPNMRDRSK